MVLTGTMRKCSSLEGSAISSASRLAARLALRRSWFALTARCHAHACPSLSIAVSNGRPHASRSCTTADESRDLEAAVHKQRVTLGCAHRLVNPASLAACPLRQSTHAVIVDKRSDAAAWADINCVWVPYGMYLRMDDHSMATKFCKQFPCLSSHQNYLLIIDDVSLP